ncbi:MAG: hypothetical protein U0X20_20565 [Caldilineaceae bacterium]
MTLRRGWLIAVLVLYLVLACYQLGLPGLHYDEAKEAGLNAMELLTGAPVTAFRSAGISWDGRTLPLMVQDYIGALNVYLALPFLAFTGIGVPNLRVLPVVTGLVALLLIERAVSEWYAYPPKTGQRTAAATPISLAGLYAITLLAASPSYVFWARQGVFVTNLMLPFVFLCLWQGVRWLRTGRPLALILAALAGGLALYAKLSAYWVVVPFALLAGGWWLYLRLSMRRVSPSGLAGSAPPAPALSWQTAILAIVAFCVPLSPLLAFNWQTGGTLASIGGNLGRSYYGVDNANILANLPVRWSQVLDVLRGDQFWYLGAVYANSLAPWLAVLAILAGLWYDWRRVLPPLLLLTAVFAASLFTVSDLFITHYVFLQPLLAAVVALALAAAGGEDAGEVRHSAIGITLRARRIAVGAVMLAWIALDLSATVRYHYTLSVSGGLADHSDASYHLAYYLQYNGMGAPIALDWGIDAPVRYLTSGAVTPIEIFGYASPSAPDAGFAIRLNSFLDNPDNRYLLHAPSATVFDGRREAFLQAVEARGHQALLEQQFGQRDGAPLYEIWRTSPP